MNSKHKIYDDDFRQSTVKMIIDQNLSARQVSQDMDIGYSTLRRWIQNYRHNSKVYMSCDDNRRLRRENAVLRQERDILKKALGIFSSSKVTGTNL